MVTDDKEKPLFSKFSKVDQIGIVVKDMGATMKFYEKMFGIEPFPTVESSVDSARLKIGLFQLGEVQIELIQVLEGETIHSRALVHAHRSTLRKVYSLPNPLTLG